MVDKTFKLVFLGESSVGKSSIIYRRVEKKFSEFLEPTIGAAFITTNVEIDNKKINLQIWDTAGQERYRSLTPMYYRGAHAAVIVYDITDYFTFMGAKRWIQEIRKNNEDCTIFLIGNKKDLNSLRKVDYNEANNYSRVNKLIFLEASAKTGNNVDEIFLQIASLLNAHKFEDKDSDHKKVNFDIKSESSYKPYRNPSCCYT